MKLINKEILEEHSNIKEIIDSNPKLDINIEDLFNDFNNEINELLGFFLKENNPWLNDNDLNKIVLDILNVSNNINGNIKDNSLKIKNGYDLLYEDLYNKLLSNKADIELFNRKLKQFNNELQYEKDNIELLEGEL